MTEDCQPGPCAEDRDGCGCLIGKRRHFPGSAAVEMEVLLLWGTRSTRPPKKTVPAVAKEGKSAGDLPAWEAVAKVRQTAHLEVVQQILQMNLQLPGDSGDLQILPIEQMAGEDNVHVPGFTGECHGQKMVLFGGIRSPAEAVEETGDRPLFHVFSMTILPVSGLPPVSQTGRCVVFIVQAEETAGRHQIKTGRLEENGRFVHNFFTESEVYIVDQRWYDRSTL